MKSGQDVPIQIRGLTVKKSDHRERLRARHYRPRHRTAREPRDELPPSHARSLALVQEAYRGRAGEPGPIAAVAVVKVG
jgi:hypothetical protein